MCFFSFVVVGVLFYGETSHGQLKDVKASLKSRYSTSKVCLETTGECLNIDPGNPKDCVLPDK